jgi:hypothetical protein
MLRIRNGSGADAPRVAVPAQTREMATFILIPGGWQGGWAFEKVEQLLTATRSSQGRRPMG